jgi:hypothetical protein
MTALDVADLVVIAGGVLGVGTDTALTRIDMPAAHAALAHAALPAAPPGRVAAAAAFTQLVHGLLRHPPFPGHSHRVGAAAGLQFLAVNGWQADLDPRAAAIVVQSLASGQLTPDQAAAWIMPRLTPLAAAHWEGPVHALRRGLRSALAPHGSGGAGMFVDGRMLARFSDDAVVVIFLAQDAARRLGHDHLEPEHFLLGLIRQRDSVAVRALRRLGVDLETLGEQVEAGVGRGPGRGAGSGAGRGAGSATESVRPIRPSRPRGQKVLNSALPEALVDGSTEMDTGHMLLAQFHDDGPAVQALTRLGAGESEVRAAVAAVLAEAAADHRPRDRKSA